MQVREHMHSPIEVSRLFDQAFSSQMALEVEDGLSKAQKRIPSKYFYDNRGSKLFEKICQLPEYYLTRLEMQILKNNAHSIMSASGEKDLVEIGAGSFDKMQILFEAVSRSCHESLTYIPVDICESAVRSTGKRMMETYPDVVVRACVADFMSQLDFSQSRRSKQFFFFGSTIGNLSEDEIIAFLTHVSEQMDTTDALFVGFDMVKPKNIIEAAYNDSQDVTAEFNKNILHVVNTELDADFDISNFQHLSFYNEKKQRIEMHLKAYRGCSVSIRSTGSQVRIEKGETIHTENSRKFTTDNILELSERSGLQVVDIYSDDNNWFSLVWFERQVCIN